jgi:hypothetical protein
MSNVQRLMYSKANQAFVFTFGDQLLRIGDSQMFYRNKADAVRAALRAGLVVDGKGFVTAVDGEQPREDSEALNGVDWVLVRASGMDDHVLSTHRTKEAAQKAMRKAGGTPDSVDQRGMRVVNVGPDSANEMIEVMGKRTIRPRSRELSGINQKDYTHYVVVETRDGKKLIESGWSYAEDAREQKKDNLPDTFKSSRVLTKTGAMREGLDPSDDKNWLTSEGFGDVSTRSRQGTRVRFNPSPGSLALYTHHPEPGEEGSVTTMPGFGKRTYLPGPGGGLLYVKWDQAGTIGVSPKDVDKVSGSKSVKGFGEWEREFKRLTYGDMPTEEEFVDRTKGHYPYPMELVGEGKNAVLDLGINLNKGGIEEFESEYSYKLGIRVLNAEAMYRFLTKLKDKHDSGEGEEEDEAGNLASAILYTLGYEWV